MSEPLKRGDEVSFSTPNSGCSRTLGRIVKVERIPVYVIEVDGEVDRLEHLGHTAEAPGRFRPRSQRRMRIVGTDDQWPTTLAHRGLAPASEVELARRAEYREALAAGAPRCDLCTRPSFELAPSGWPSGAMYCS